MDRFGRENPKIHSIPGCPAANVNDEAGREPVKDKTYWEIQEAEEKLKGFTAAFAMTLGDEQGASPRALHEASWEEPEEKTETREIPRSTMMEAKNVDGSEAGDQTMPVVIVTPVAF